MLRGPPPKGAYSKCGLYTEREPRAELSSNFVQKPERTSWSTAMAPKSRVT